MRRLTRFNIVSLILGLAFLHVPLVLIVIYSFNRSELVTVWGGFSTRWYASLWQNEQLIDAAMNSLVIATLAASIATVLGTLVAVTLAGHPRRWVLVLLSALVFAPMVLPEVILGLAQLLLFVSGGVDRGLFTITAAHATQALGFAAVTVYARLVSVDPSIAEAARDLGCPPGRTFLLVTLPMIAPAVAAGWALSFILSLDNFVLSTFNSGPGSTTLPMRIFSALRLGVTPEINALSTVLMVAVLLGTAAYLLVSLRRSARRTAVASAAS
jgi:putrescine transport system permease protein